MTCIYNKDEFCTNAECPMCGDYCPIPYDDGVCKYEEREEEVWKLTPKGCFVAALKNYVHFDDNVIDFLWRDFERRMIKLGYAEEDYDE